MYGDLELYGPFVAQMAAKMKANAGLVERNRKIRSNLASKVETVEEIFTLYLAQCKEREESRIYYDHYRAKLE